jgi:hypothetical protein
MSISERELEENEVKLDNILHKIVVAAKQIETIQENINPDAPAEYSKQLLEDIAMLAETIENLAEAADDIDIVDEHVTKELKEDIEGKLDDAIERITAARSNL